MSRYATNRVVDISPIKTNVTQQGQHQQSFKELQRGMEDELERRRSEWEEEVSEMSDDFFNVDLGKNIDRNIKKDIEVNTTTEVDGSVPKRVSKGTKPEICLINDSRNLFTELADGSRLYKVRFDVRDFHPRDISVKVENGRLTVHTYKKDNFSDREGSSTKNFNRQVDVPYCVDPDMITSYLSQDGILTVEAPVMKQQQEDTTADEQRVSYSDNNITYMEDDTLQQTLNRIRAAGAQSAGGYSPAGGGYSYELSQTRNVPTFSSLLGQNVPSYSREVTYEMGGPQYYSSKNYSTREKMRNENHKRVPESSRYVLERAYKNAVPLTGTAGASYYSSSHTPTVITRTSEIPSTTTRYYNSSSTGGLTSPLGYSLLDKTSRYNEPTIVTSEEGRRLRMILNLGRDYTPDEVNVTIDGRRILVNAKHEEIIDERKSKRDFSREFESPEGIIYSTLKAQLDNEGRLHIGSSVRSNDDHDAVEQVVMSDMPSWARNVITNKL